MESLIHTNGSAIFHTRYGSGIVVDSTAETVTIRFEDGATKTFSIKTCLMNNYLLPSEKKSKKWFESVKWTETCRDCHRKNKGVCLDRACAELNYDEWGDPIPLKLYFHDGNRVAEYLAEKRSCKKSAQK